MSNVMFSEMIIDDLELEFNSKTKFQRHQTKNNGNAIQSGFLSQNSQFELNKNQTTLNTNLTNSIIDESLRKLFPYLNDQVSDIYL